MNKQKLLLIPLILLLFLAACGSADEEPAVEERETAVANTNNTETADTPQSTPFSTDKYADLEIVTLLPKDAIPALNNPEFLSAADADRKYDPDELVIGVEFNGEARAYSVPFLSSHEIVNDTVGGVKIAVTW